MSAARTCSVSSCRSGSTFLHLATEPAGEHRAEPFRPAGLGQDPGPYFPRWRVSDVLRVAALELGDPVLLRVLVKADDASTRTHFPTRRIGHSVTPMPRWPRAR